MVKVVQAYVAVSDPIAKLQFLGVGWGGGDARRSLGASQEVPAEATCHKEHSVNVQMFQNYGLGVGDTTRPKPLVGHAKHVPKVQVTTELRTSRSKKRSCRQMIPVVDI